MKRTRSALALTLLLGPANVAVAAGASFKPVGIDQAAKLVIGNTVVVDAHPRSAYDKARRFYPSLDQVYECGRIMCYTHSVQIVKDQLCEPDLIGQCHVDEGRWYFRRGDWSSAPPGSRIGSFVSGTGGHEEIHAIFKGNVTGFPRFTPLVNRLRPVTVDARTRSSASKHRLGQTKRLERQFEGNTLIGTVESSDVCLEGGEYYSPDKRLISLGCGPKSNDRKGEDYDIYLLHWRIAKGRLCSTSRQDPHLFTCLGSKDIVISDAGPYKPPPGRLAIKVDPQRKLPLLRGNIFHFHR